MAVHSEVARWNKIQPLNRTNTDRTLFEGEQIVNPASPSATLKRLARQAFPLESPPSCVIHSHAVPRRSQCEFSPSVVCGRPFVPPQPSLSPQFLHLARFLLPRGYD